MESQSTFKKTWYEIEVQLEDGRWNRRYWSTKLDEAKLHLESLRDTIAPGHVHRLLKVEADCEVIG